MMLLKLFKNNKFSSISTFHMNLNLLPKSNYFFYCEFNSDKPLNVIVPRKELTITFSRSSGPGGQNVNKLNTKVQLKFKVSEAEWIPEEIRERFLELSANRINKQGEFVITSEKTRVQHSNLSDAVSKLQEIIDESCISPKERIATKVPTWAIEKRLKDKKRKKDLRRNEKNFKDIQF